MKKLLAFLSCILMLLGSAMVGYAAPCSGRFALTYPSYTGTTTTPYFNNGSGSVNIDYCPTSGGSVSITINSESEGTFTFTGPNGFSQSHTFIETTGANKTVPPFTFTLPSSAVNSTFTMTSLISCGGGKNSSFTFTLSPSLTVTSSADATQGVVCPNTPVTINASGASASSVYTLLANGIFSQSNATGIFSVTPKNATTYTVSTNTAACGSNAVTQNITINTNNLTLNTSATNVASGGSVTLTADAGATGSSYVWASRTSTSGAFTTIAGQTTSTLTRNPTLTTEYRVSGTTAAGNCPSTVSRLITVNGAPLPVELISFDAAWNGKTPVLTWATALEKNSAYFDVERSYDGQRFEKVDQHPAAGNSSSRIDYQFTDTRFGAVGPVVYYRLQQVDISGETNYSPVRVLRVTTGANAFEAAVFPNPYTNTAAVRFHSSGDTSVRLSLHNVLGQSIFTKLVTAEAGVQEVALPLVSSLPLGVYYLTIQQGNQQKVVRISHQ